MTEKNFDKKEQTNENKNQYFNSAPSIDELEEIKNLKHELDLTKTEIENLKKEADSYKDNLLRTAAELQNTQNRMKREIEDTNKYAISKFAKDLINVHDNLHRALEAFLNNSQENINDTLVEGIKITLKEFDNVLNRYGIERIVPEKGTDFDPNLHEALTSVPTEEFKENTIMDVIQAGFLIKDRVLRAARVIVAARGE